MGYQKSTSFIDPETPQRPREGGGGDDKTGAGAHREEAGCVLACLPAMLRLLVDASFPLLHRARFLENCGG